MSFRCEKCGNVATNLTRLVTETREKKYTMRTQKVVHDPQTGQTKEVTEHTPVVAKQKPPAWWDNSRGKFKPSYANRKQATGWEIVREAKVCPDCAK